jgi:glutathione S-transferase
MSDSLPTLFIGNRNYSSWSLRPWLCLRWGKIDFEASLISLAQEGYGNQQIKEILQFSPAGKVPALRVGDLSIWDSLAIAEWAAEQAPELWPADAGTRAHARSVVCEMHSGFPDLRDQLSMNINRRCTAYGLSEGTMRDIHRIMEMWQSLRSEYAVEGPWLFGQRSIADAFYTPVATRFRTYGIELPENLLEYSDTLLSDDDFLQWEASPVTDRFDFIDQVFMT